jgi:putative inorganic carbon (HCO3(-)) transporter
VEQGVMGLAVAVAFSQYLKIKTLDCLMQVNKQSLAQKLSAAAGFIALVGFIWHGLFDTIWYRPAIQLLFWFFVAVWAGSTFAPQKTDLESGSSYDND